jgi:hypothetical protein
MGKSLQKRCLTSKAHRALELLASNAQGAPEALLLVHGFTRPNAIANSRKPGERRTPISRPEHEGDRIPPCGDKAPRVSSFQ